MTFHDTRCWELTSDSSIACRYTLDGRLSAEGVLRIHTARGWLSTQAADGSKLLEAVYTDDEDDESTSSGEYESSEDDGVAERKDTPVDGAPDSTDDEATIEVLPALAGAAAQLARRIAPALAPPLQSATTAPSPAPPPPSAPAPAPQSSGGGASTVAMRALLERLGAIQEECNECRRRWEEERAAADIARNGEAQAQAEAAQVRRGLQQTIATLKKSEKSLKTEVAAQCEAKDALLRTVEALEAANARAEAERDEQAATMESMQQMLTELQDEMKVSNCHISALFQT